MSGYPGGGYPGAPAGYPVPGAPSGYPPAGGYGGGAPPIDPAVSEWFRAVDQDNSGQIDAKELGQVIIAISHCSPSVVNVMCQALANGDMTMFSEEACRMMINMFDSNMTGTIDVHEFGKLFAFINEKKRMFEGYDRNKEGTLSQDEFLQALQAMGYR